MQVGPRRPSERTLVCIVNWNGAVDTSQCLRSLTALDSPETFRIAVVDNGSTDTSVPALRAAFPDIELVETGENLGFAGANNVIIEHALELGFDYVWMLNNDTTVAPGALSALVDDLDAHPDAGVVGSKILYFSRPDTIWYAGGGFTWTGSSRHRGVGEVDRGQYDEPGETGYVTGCSLLARVSAVREAGLMDASYFLYWEEAEWEERIRRAGWSVRYAPASVVWHKVSASTAQLPNQAAVRYEARNRVRFYRSLSALRTFTASMASVFQAAKFAVRGRGALAAAVLGGLSDGYAGRSGKIPEQP